MDAISIAIVVTVLSVGSVLVYLFKSDFEARQKSLVQSISSSSKKNVHNKNNLSTTVLSPSSTGRQQQQVGSITSHKQQVPSEVSKAQIVVSSSQQQSSSNASNTKSSNSNKSINQILINDATSGNSNKANSVKQQQQQSITKQSVNNSKSRGDNVAPTSTNKSLITGDSSDQMQDDETDSSILLGVFNPTNTVQRSGKLSGKKSPTTSQVVEMKRRNNKKHFSAEPIASEQLFSLIASSNLSKDEIELAVETLLNKLESGESNWQQPKNDPLCRLKARLRDHETALTTEIANHENTRARLGVINSSLEQARVDLNRQQLLQKQMKEEKAQVVRQLEQTRCDLTQQKMIQKQRQEESSQAIEKVEQDKAQLQSMLLDLQMINGRQEDMLKRLRDERHMNEASMKRTLLEMEHELKELQSKLSANSASHDERHRKEMSQVERELNIADQREQKLMSEMRELRQGLSALFPDLKASRVGAEDWVPQYLAAVKQLTKTVDELREINKNIGANNNNNNNNNNDILDSPSKKSVVDKSTSTLLNNKPSSRVSSPTSNGRSSKAGNYSDNDGKKEMETKLLELSSYVIKLEDEMTKTKQENLEKSLKLNQMEQQLQQPQSSTEQLIKDLKLQKSKLEAQVKIGLDSLKMEQERTKSLEEELSKFSHSNSQAQAAS